MMFRIPVLYIPFAALTALAAVSCSPQETSGQGDILVKVGSATLSRQDLQKAIPYGLTPEDSVKFAKSFIANWIDDDIIDEIAIANINDTRDIDAMVAEYRRDLIMREYRRRMFDQNTDAAPGDDEIETYYETHKQQLRTSEPLIKGIYVRLPDDSHSLSDIRKWYRSDKADDIDRLEKACDDTDVSYEYFRDRWVEWSAVKNMIPYDFGTNPDHFLRTHKFLDTSRGGSVYLLAITEYLPVGSVKPLEIAKPEILERLIATRRMEYDRKLRKELYDMAIKSGEIVVY